MTLRQAYAMAEQAKCRVIEQVSTKGGYRLNVVMPNGKPRTIKCEAPEQQKD